MKNQEISIFNDRKFQNAISLFNERAKTPIVPKVTVEKKYKNYPPCPVERTISRKDFARMLKSKRLAKYQKTFELYLSTRQKIQREKQNIIDSLQKAMKRKDEQLVITDYYPKSKTMSSIIKEFGAVPFSVECKDYQMPKYRFHFKKVYRQQKIARVLA